MQGTPDIAAAGTILTVFGRESNIAPTQQQADALRVMRKLRVVQQQLETTPLTQQPTCQCNYRSKTNKKLCNYNILMVIFIV